MMLELAQKFERCRSQVRSPISAKTAERVVQTWDYELSRTKKA